MTARSRVNMDNKKDVWSIWYNTDRPYVGAGDSETVERIENMYDRICRQGFTIAAAQCRDLRSHVVFDSSTTDYSPLAHLTTPCTSAGVECINTHMIAVGEKKCADYAIRFKCTYTGEQPEDESLFPQFDVRIYIILAVFPILIFLLRILWAYIFRRRRQRRREARREARQRRAAERGGDDLEDDYDRSSIASELANPPPSYHQIFGERPGESGGSSVFAISRGNVPVCNRCATTPCSVAFILKDSNNVNPLSENYRESRSTPSGVPPPLPPPPPPASQTQNEGSSLSQGDIAAEIIPTNAPVRADVQSTTQSSTVVVVENDPPHYTPSEGSGSAQPESDATTNHHRPLQALNSISTVDTFVDTRSEYSRNNSMVDAEDGREASQQTRTTHGDVEADSSAIEIELQERPAQTSSPQGTTTSTPPPPPPPLPAALSSSSRSPPSSPTATTTSTSLSSPLPPPPSSNEAPLFSPLDSTTLSTNGISQPCACACHRTIPYEGQGVSGYTNAGFVTDEDTARSSRFPGMHREVPGLHRVWSHVSVASVVTLSELPSYEAALELIKKKESEAKEDEDQS